MQVKQSDFKRFSILFAEDDTTVLENIGYMLKAYFKAAYLAKNGEEAFDLYRQHKPDIILTDIRMPVMDGIALVKAVRKHDALTPIIMITAFSDEKTLLEAVRLYLEDYLVKPVSHAGLIETLSGCIRKLLANQPEAYNFCESLRYSFVQKALIDGGRLLPLTHHEIDLLELLIKKRGQPVSYEEIEEEVWKNSYMSKDAIKTLIKKLRGKLRVACIHNIVGYGYKLQ